MKQQFVSLTVMAMLLSTCVSEHSQSTIRFEGIHGTGWISDQEITFAQSMKIGIDEHQQPKYRHTMGIKDVTSREVKGEKPSISYDVYAKSPDGRHIYVKQDHMEGENLVAEHRIINQDGRETKEIANLALTGSAVWIDNEHVIYRGGIGDEGVTLIDLQGKITPMPELNQLMEFQQLTKIGERLYYVGAGGFSYIELSQLENPVQYLIYDKPVNRFYPSPDGQQIAVVTTEHSSSPDRTKSELFLLDPDGNPIGDHLETGNYFYRISWSRDQSNLAYVVTKQYPVKYEVHVVDLKNGENKVIYKSGNQLQSSEMLWSPNSKLLMFTLSHSSVEPKAETIIYKVK